MVFGRYNYCYLFKEVHRPVFCINNPLLQIQSCLFV
jgi:hypothetical protein